MKLVNCNGAAVIHSRLNGPRIVWWAAVVVGTALVGIGLVAVTVVGGAAGERLATLGVATHPPATPSPLPQLRAPSVPSAWPTDTVTVNGATMSAQTYEEIESKPKDLPVLAGPFGTGYIDRDEVFLPPKGLRWGFPIPNQFGSDPGYNVYDKAGKHLGWFVPGLSGGGFMTDAQAAAAGLLHR
jgi:hypothetical protein